MTYTATLRDRVSVRLGVCPTCKQATGEGGIRAVAEQIGMGHSTLWRFLRGGDITGKNIDLIEAWLAAPQPVPEDAP